MRILGDLIAEQAGGKKVVYTSRRPTFPIPLFWPAPLDDTGLSVIKAQIPELVNPTMASDGGIKELPMYIRFEALSLAGLLQSLSQAPVSSMQTPR